MVSAPRTRGVVELVLAGVAALGSAACWSRVCSTVLVAPIADGEPVIGSVRYNPQWLTVTLLLAAVAGVLGVVGAARLFRARRAIPSGV